MWAPEGLQRFYHRVHAPDECQCCGPGDLNDAEGLKDLGLFSSVPDVVSGGKVMASAFSSSNASAAPRAVRIRVMC